MDGGEVLTAGDVLGSVYRSKVCTRAFFCIVGEEVFAFFCPVV